MLALLASPEDTQAGPDAVAGDDIKWWIGVANKKPFRATELMTDIDGNKVQSGQWAVSLIWYQYHSDVPDGIRYSRHSRVERTIALNSCLFVTELRWMAYEDMQRPMGFVLSNDHVEKLQAEWLSVRPRD